MATNSLSSLSSTKVFERMTRAGKSVRWITVMPLLALCSNLGAAPQVEFTLSTNSSVDRGLSYDNFIEAGAGVDPDGTFAIGFEIDILSVDGNPVDLDPVAAFCAELEEPIGTETYTFDLSPLSSLAAGRAGETGTASSGIPSGGIGALRAARLAYLFDLYYTSDNLTEWTMTDAQPTLHAFQFAVWEITHDDDLSLLSGDVQLGAQTGGSNQEITRRQNAANLADSWLSSVRDASITWQYVSQKFTFYSLTDTDFNGSTGAQDVILAFDKESPKTETFESFTTPVPEPNTFPLLLGMIAGTFVLSRRRRDRR